MAPGRVIPPALLWLLSTSVLGASVSSRRSSRQSMLSSGLMDSDATLETLRQNAKKYKEANMVNAFGPLLYSVSQNGSFAINRFGTPTSGRFTGIEFTQKIQKETGLDVYPYLYCDNTFPPEKCGSGGIAAVLGGDPQDFYRASVEEAHKYGWKGYQVDVEGMSSGDELAQFCEQWGQHLHEAGLELQVWVSHNFPDAKAMASSASVDLVINMDAYFSQQSASSYISMMSSWQARVGAKGGSAILTPSSQGAPVSKATADEICKAAAEQNAAQMNFWASVIPDDVWGCLCTYLQAPCPKRPASSLPFSPAATTTVAFV